MVVLFGNLHSHSRLSDDTDTVPAAIRAQMTPLFGYTHAQEAGLDFLAISDHQKGRNVTSEGIQEPENSLSMSEDEYLTQLVQVANDYNAAHQGQFVAIAGIEWGNTATGNHMNVLGLRELPPRGTGTGPAVAGEVFGREYDKVFAWARTHADFVQFNHPGNWKAEGSHRDLSVGNFGEALYPTNAAFVAGAGDVVATCAVLNSVQGGHINGPHAHEELRLHRDLNWGSYVLEWRRLLNMGFHLAPTADQDTHRLNYGTVSAARTAVWAKSRSYADLIEAFKARRVYATEDDEMVVALQVESGGRTYWMGDTVPLEDEQADVTVVVRVWQAPGVTNDALEEGPYEIDVWRDEDGIDNQQAAKMAPTHAANTGEELRFPLHVTRGQYFFLEVRETNGKDNLLGEGDDERNNANPDDHHPDGLRDNPNDTAITAPIWFAAPFAGPSSAPTSTPAPSGQFAWTSNSNSHVYHDVNCWAVRQIGATNLQTGDTPPAGRTKHNCHPPH
jgi:hypothetical protein